MQNTMKFAVSRIVKNEETVLTLFEANQKEAAVSYGEQAAREYSTGLIIVFKAAFTTEGNRADNRVRLYEGLECGESCFS